MDNIYIYIYSAWWFSWNMTGLFFHSVGNSHRYWLSYCSDGFFQPPTSTSDCLKSWKKDVETKSPQKWSTLCSRNRNFCGTWTLPGLYNISELPFAGTLSKQEPATSVLRLFVTHLILKENHPESIQTFSGHIVLNSPKIQQHPAISALSSKPSYWAIRLCFSPHGWSSVWLCTQYWALVPPTGSRF